MRQCFYCTQPQKRADWKDADTLRNFVSEEGAIIPRKRSGCCAKHQRQIAKAIKKARQMGLLPYTTRTHRFPS